MDCGTGSPSRDEPSLAPVRSQTLHGPGHLKSCALYCFLRPRHILRGQHHADARQTSTAMGVCRRVSCCSLYDQLHLLDACDMPRTHATAKPYVLAGIRNSVYADILTVVDPCQPTIVPGSSAKLQPATFLQESRACYRCGAFGNFASVCLRPPHR